MDDETHWKYDLILMISHLIKILIPKHPVHRGEEFKCVLSDLYVGKQSVISRYFFWEAQIDARKLKKNFVKTSENEGA